MNNSKLIRILNVCNNEEIKLIEKCIYSPFFNENIEVQQLWLYVKKYRHDKNSPKLQKENIHQKLFQMQAYNDAKMRRLMSILVHIIEQFLFLQVNKNSFLFKQSMTQIYYERYLDKEFEACLADLALENERTGKKNTQYYENELVIEKYKMYAAFKKNKIQKGSEDRNLLNVIKNKDKSYLIGQLELVCAWLNNKNTFEHSQYITFLDNVISFYQKHYQDDSDVPILHVYLSIKKIFEHQHLNLEQEILALSDYLNKNESLFHKNEMAYFATILRNIVSRLSTQIPHYQFLLLSLYKKHIENGSIFNYNKIGADVFIRIVMLAIKQNERVWLSHFMQNYASRIPFQQQESTLLFSNALLAFSQKLYQEALKYLINTEKIANPIFELKIKILYLKIYHHLQDDDATYLAQNNLKAYIQRTTSLSQIEKKKYQLFLSFFSKIYYCSNTEKTEKKEQLIAEIRCIKNIKEKDWLLSL